MMCFETISAWHFDEVSCILINSALQQRDGGDGITASPFSYPTDSHRGCTSASLRNTSPVLAILRLAFCHGVMSIRARRTSALTCFAWSEHGRCGSICRLYRMHHSMRLRAYRIFEVVSQQEIVVAYLLFGTETSTLYRKWTTLRGLRGSTSFCDTKTTCR